MTIDKAPYVENILKKTGLYINFFTPVMFAYKVVVLFLQYGTRTSPKSRCKKFRNSLTLEDLDKIRIISLGI